MDTAIMLEKAL